MERFALDLNDIADLEHEVAIPGAIRTGWQGGETYEQIVRMIEIINGG